jgi:hypothetical protein
MASLSQLIDSSEILNEAQLKAQREGALFAPQEQPSYEPKRDHEPHPFSSPRQEVVLRQSSDVPLSQPTSTSPSKPSSPALPKQDKKVMPYTHQESNPSYAFGPAVEETKLPMSVVPRNISFPERSFVSELDFTTVKTAFHLEDTYEITPVPITRQSWDNPQISSEQEHFIFPSLEGSAASSMQNQRLLSSPVDESQVLRASLEDPRQFAVKPLPQHVWLKCRVLRSPAGLFSLGSKFSLVTEEGLPLLSAKRVASSVRSYYRIAYSSEALTEDALLGRLHSNYLGSIFNLFDNGLAPGSREASEDNLREELASVTYVSSM